MKDNLSRVVFFVLAACCLIALAPISQTVMALLPPAALLAGAILALTLGNPYPAESKKLGKILLQASVVLLGFSVDLGQILTAGKDGILFALVSITTVFALGYGLQKLLKVRRATSLLVCMGTAICGGSAIAALSSVIDAPQEDISVSVATVFVLNGIALILFPPLGHAFGMSAGQFGIWSGIAIHDVSSVVGAATAFGGGALQVATAVKLSRVLYIVPITLIASYAMRRKSGEATEVRAQTPWFVGLFILASVLRSESSLIAGVAPIAKIVAVAGFALCLFLIGAGISRKVLKSVGVRPMAQGVALWIFVSVAAFFAARSL